MNNVIKNISLVLLTSVLLSGCGAGNFFGEEFDLSDERDSQERTVERIVVQDLPNIDIPPPPTLLAWEFNLPRDTSQDMIVDDRSECQNVPENERDEEFWENCGEYPVIGSTNILLGLTRDNLETLQINLARLKENNQSLRELLKLVNEQREELRQRQDELSDEYEIEEIDDLDTNSQN